MKKTFHLRIQNALWLTNSLLLRRSFDPHFLFANSIYLTLNDFQRKFWISISLLFYWTQTLLLIISLLPLFEIQDIKRKKLKFLNPRRETLHARHKMLQNLTRYTRCLFYSRLWQIRFIGTSRTRSWIQTGGRKSSELAMNWC